MPRVYHANLSFCCKPEFSDRATSSATGMRGALAMRGAGCGMASRLTSTTAALASAHSSSHMRKWGSILAKKREKTTDADEESSFGLVRCVGGEGCDWSATQSAEGGAGGIYSWLVYSCECLVTQALAASVGGKRRQENYTCGVSSAAYPHLRTDIR